MCLSLYSERRLDSQSFENLERVGREILIVILSTQRPLWRDGCYEGICGQGGIVAKQYRTLFQRAH